jgi:hypothetical protein
VQAGEPQFGEAEERSRVDALKARSHFVEKEER